MKKIAILAIILSAPTLAMADPAGNKGAGTWTAFSAGGNAKAPSGDTKGNNSVSPGLGKITAYTAKN